MLGIRLEEWKRGGESSLLVLLAYFLSPPSLSLSLCVCVCVEDCSRKCTTVQCGRLKEWWEVAVGRTSQGIYQDVDREPDAVNVRFVGMVGARREDWYVQDGRVRRG